MATTITVDYTAIDDGYFLSALPTYTFAADTGLHSDGSPVRHVILRAGGANFAEGTYTVQQLSLRNESGLAPTIRTHVISDANTWGHIQVNQNKRVGAFCWNQAKYAQQNWAGSVGCGTDGVDRDTAYAQSAVPANGWVTIDLATPNIFSSWASGDRVANGVLIRNITSSGIVFASTLRGLWQPYFYGEYFDPRALLAVLA